MSNLLSIHNSKNQIGIGTNSISVSSSLTIKEDSKRYIVFNTNNNSINTYRPIELEETTTLSTVKTNSISSPKILYISSNNLISSLSFSSSANTYFKVSNVGGLGLVDKTAPTVVSFTISDTSLKVGETATVTLQFSESVSGFNSDADITEHNGSLATMTSSDNITWTGTFTPTDDIEDTTNIIQLATSYTDSAGNIGPTAQTANYSIDTKEPYLDNPNNIGTTTDRTPTFTFTSNEAGTITSSLSFSTSNTAIAGSNSITFNTLGNSTYSSQWVKVTDAAGNISNTLYIPSFTVAGNPYGTTDIRYHMWNQNMQTGSETRGYVGYVNISCMIQGTAFYVLSLGSKWLYFTTNLPHSALSSWNANFGDGNGRYDEHTFKIVYNSGSNNYTITPDSSSWSSSTGNPFKHDMRVYISATGSSGSFEDYHSNPAVQMTHISGTSSQSSTWSVYNAAAGSTYKIAYGQKLHYRYTTGYGYGYVAVLAPSPPKSDYVQSMSTYSSEQTIFKFI